MEPHLREHDPTRSPRALERYLISVCLNCPKPSCTAGSCDGLRFAEEKWRKEHGDASVPEKREQKPRRAVQPVNTQMPFKSPVWLSDGKPERSVKKVDSRAIRKRLKEKGLSIRAASEIAGIWEQTLCRVLRGGKARKETVYKIAAVLQVSPEEICMGTAMGKSRKLNTRKIWELLRQRDETMKDASFAIGFSASAVRMMLAHGSTKYASAQALAEHLGVDVDELIQTEE